MKLRLPNATISPQDLTALILELHDYAKWLSHEAIKNRVTKKHVSTPPALSPAASEMIKIWTGKHALDHQTLDALIASLERHRASAQVMTITLAAEPPHKLKEQLVAWCRENLSVNVLISFQFNRTLLGGIVIRYGSRVFDWSLHRALNENKQKFPEVLRHV